MLSSSLAFSLVAGVQEPESMLATGKKITPIGVHREVGSYPANILPLADGLYAAVTTMGYRQSLSIIRLSDGETVGKVDIPRGGPRPTPGLYFGLAFDSSSRTLYASRGAMDRVSRYQVGRAGGLTPLDQDILNPAPEGSQLPLHPAGIALTSQADRLVTANNQTGYQTDYRGSVSLISLATGKEERRIPVRGFPYALALLTKGPHADKLAFVASERDGVVEVVDLALGAVTSTIPTGAAPAGMVLSKDQTRLYVSNGHSDSISVIDTAARRVIDTILVRPPELPGLPGATPQGMALSPDETTLYAALSDMNALAVVDLKQAKLVGYLPTGWLPTSVCATEKELLIACAKGVQAKNPNSKPVGEKGTYIQDIIAGTVTRLPLPLPKKLKDLTRQVILNNRLQKGLNKARFPGFVNPGITHVIYVIKENRTYDNVLGDLPQGNGDPSICLFPRPITPNQHALAERFVLLDNFHVCAEVSQDGWVWSTAGSISPYASRNTPYNYSGRGRNYDTEGSNNGVPVDLIDLPDVSRPAGGYIWELCAKHKVSYRNYGFFTQFADIADKRYSNHPMSGENMPSKKLLEKMTNTNFRRYDLSYADSEAYLKHDFSWPRQTKTYGAFNSPSRFTEWKREFDQFVKDGKMPHLQMVRFGQNHTSGTANGQPTPQSMVADNDYALGQMVEAVSKSPFWKTTLICVVEDDAQNGIDHVDAHRSTAFLISPHIKKGTIDSRFYNTSSMLRTIELALGLPPMNQYDAVAGPINVFAAGAANDEPYQAILPSRDIVCAVNSRTAYRSRDSERISWYIEEGDIDEELNDILWTSIMGPDRPMPAIRRGGIRLRLEDD
jgi:YVTN family beta-propeller protein